MPKYSQIEGEPAQRILKNKTKNWFAISYVIDFVINKYLYVFFFKYVRYNSYVTIADGCTAINWRFHPVPAKLEVFLN